MPNETADQIRNLFISKMGQDLGAYFFALYEGVIALHRKWAEFVDLFGTESQVDLLNEAARDFIGMVEDALYDETVLHISRLTDKGREKLTIRNLPPLVLDRRNQDAIRSLVDTAIAKQKVCREHRDCRIAHTNRDLALNRSATPLPELDKRVVDEAISALAAVMYKVHRQYLNETLEFDARPIGWAQRFLNVVFLGVESRKQNSLGVLRKP